MKAKPKKTKDCGCVSENHSKPELSEDVMRLLKKPFDIIAIVCAGNKIDFYKNDDTIVTKRLVFKDLQEWLCPLVFLRIHRCWAVNMHYVVEESHVKNEWWVKLTNRQCYNVSDTYYEIFLDNLNYMFKYKRVRERFERIRHKKLFSSRFDV